MACGIKNNFSMNISGVFAFFAVCFVMPLWRKRTHTHTLRAHSLGLKNFFLHYLQVIKLTDEQHLTQMAGRFPAMLSGYHLKETSKNQESFEETSANGPATNFMISPDRLSSNSMMVSRTKTVLREKSEC